MPRIKVTGSRQTLRSLVAAGVGCLIAGLTTSPCPAGEANPTTIPVTIETPYGRRTIQAEVACRLDERALGLMGRASLAPDSGMIFLLPAPRPMRLWMKDTPLALDIIFFDSSLKIIRIEENAEPMRERVIESGGGVLGVLEIAGGRADKLKISHGDKILYTYPQKHCE
ncbi:MAG: DUF192 domain-containing protein [Alphaproteobacteria bacterium]|nr:DUF192 domain-containing protein [Alphaproteobacteria bacterium]